MKTILFIAFEFPPANTGGSHRPYKLANSLYEKDWHPVVLTIKTEGSPKGTEPDESLSKKINPNIPVIRTELRPINWWDKILQKGYGTVPDICWRRWKNSLLNKLPEIIEQIKPKAIYITFPPFSLNKLAVWLKKNYPSIPLISDMRDAWSFWVISPYASYLHFKNIQRQEKRLLEISDCVLVTSRQTMADFLTLYPGLTPSKFSYLPNGFSEFTDTEQKNMFGKRVRIGYVGSFYYNPRTQNLLETKWYKKKPYQWFQYFPRMENWRYRSPLYFFKLLNRFKQFYPVLSSRLELIFAGRKPDWFDKMAEENGVSHLITHLGPINQHDSIEFQASCDWLLLTSSKVVGGKDYSIAGKTFEYFSLRKPIIALVCEGAQKEILANSGMACIIDPDKPEEGVEALKKIVEGKFVLQPNDRFIQEFKMDALSDRFVEILKKL